MRKLIGKFMKLPLGLKLISLFLTGVGMWFLITPMYLWIKDQLEIGAMSVESMLVGAILLFIVSFVLHKRL